MKALSEKFHSDLRRGTGPRKRPRATVPRRARQGQSLSATLDVQKLINPALNPDADVIAVFGLRGRLVF